VINWSLLLTIFLAIIVARITEGALFSRGSSGTSTSVGAETHSPAQSVVVYANPIDEFLAKNYPNAR